jgi:hypothetical protein
MRRLFIVLAILATFSSPSNAQSIVDAKSQISIPAKIDDMSVQTSNRPARSEYAKGYSYENGSDRIEINVVRASYANVAIWFPSAVKQAKQMFGGLVLEPDSIPMRFTAKANKANGMIQVFKTNGPFPSTAVAVAGFGNWLVFIHSTSKKLDLAAQRMRMGKILAAINPAKSITGAYPMVAPADCPAALSGGVGPEGEPPLSNISLEMKLSGGLAASLTSNDAFGLDEEGIARKPEAYCRLQSPTGKTVWYRTLASAKIPRWILPISITGATTEGIVVPSTDKKGKVISIGVLITNGYTSSDVRAFYSLWPNPVSAQLTAITALAANLPPYASVAYGTRDVQLGK